MASRTDFVKNELGKEAVFYSLALEQAQFGSFKYAVLAICGLVIASVSAPGSSSLQARRQIACDLAIDYDQQMKINVCTLIAMISGSLLIAVPSDLASRLKPFLASLIFYGLSTLGLGFCREYYCFAAFSVLRAFWASALLTTTTVYLAEIQTPRYRGSSLCCLQIFWLFGLVVTPVLSIPWRTSQFIFGALDLALVILVVFFFAESPRLLLSLGKEAAAVESLGKIYRRNYLRNREVEYPVKNLVDDFSPEAESLRKFRTYVPGAFRPPWYSIFVVLQIQFFFNLCFFTMGYWFAEINTRHVLIFPTIPVEIDRCKLGERYLPAEVNVYKKNDSESTSALNSSCKDSAYIDADYSKKVLILAVSTLPVLIWMILSIDRIGRTYFTTLSHLIAGLLSFVVHYLIGTKSGLFYSTLMETMWMVSMTASSCLVTEIFKTKLRVLGLGLANSFGSLGTAMGIYGLMIKGGGSCVFVLSLTGILVTDLCIYNIIITKLNDEGVKRFTDSMTLKSNTNACNIFPSYEPKFQNPLLDTCYRLTIMLLSLILRRTTIY